jgi:hypothetical protein
MADRFVPDIDNYQKIIVPPGSGCGDCVIRHTPGARCTPIPCTPQMGQPHYVIYVEKIPDPISLT